MEIQEQTKDGLNRRYKVKHARADVEKAMELKFNDLTKRVKINGFRPGKVPLSLIKQRYENSVLEEVYNDFVKKSVDEVVDKYKLKTVQAPDFEVITHGVENDFEYMLQAEIFPEFEIVDHKQFKLEKVVCEASKAEIDEAMTRIVENNKSWQSVAKKRAAKLGDLAVIDFEGTVEGKLLQGGTATDYRLELGSNSFVPGFEDQLVGHEKGEQFEIHVTFPANYAADLASKDATFKITIKDLEEVAPSKRDDALAKSQGLESLEALEKAIKDELERQFQVDARAIMKRRLLDVLAEHYTFDTPQSLVDNEYNTIWTQLKTQMEKDGEKLDEDDKALKVEYTTIAQRRVRLGLVLAEIGRKHAINVTQDELSREIYRQAMTMPGHEAQVIEFFKKNKQAVQSLRAPIFEDKVVDYIFDHANTTIKTVTSAELSKMVQALHDGDEALDKPKKVAKSASKPSTEPKADAKEASPKKKAKA